MISNKNLSLATLYLMWFAGILLGVGITVTVYNVTSRPCHLTVGWHEPGDHPIRATGVELAPDSGAERR